MLINKGYNVFADYLIFKRIIPFFHEIFLQRIDYNPTMIFKEAVGIATSFKPRSPALSFGLALVRTIHIRT